MPSEPMEPIPDINLVDPGLYSHGDPFAQWRWLRAHQPVFRHPETELPPFWALTRYDDIRTAYRDAETFSSAQGILLRPTSHGTDPGGGRTLALTDAPRHRQLRQLVDEWFTVRSVRALEEEMRGIAESVVASALDQESCDFVTKIAARIPLYVICRMMGVPESDWPHMYDLTSRAFAAGDPLTRRFAHLDILGYFEELLEEKARMPGDDLVSALVTGTVDGKRLDAEEVILNCDNLLVGGTENTRIAAAAGMLALLEHPDQWRMLQEDRALLAPAVEEVLRWTSTATHIMRTATRPVEIRGTSIAAGDRVVFWLPSANRDESVFEEPDRFDVTRQPNRHLSLGFGEHFCLGGMLARVELRLLYGELLAKSDGIELTGEPKLLDSIVVNGPESLPVLLKPRSARPV